jgi:hypothetical protein
MRTAQLKPGDPLYDDPEVHYAMISNGLTVPVVSIR